MEQQADDGAWRELASRYTIEFRAQAARPASKAKREFTVPVDSPNAQLRIAVRGVGQVAISHATLTDGVTVRQTRDYRRKKILGRRASRGGFPAIDWLRNIRELILRF